MTGLGLDRTAGTIGFEQYLSQAPWAIEKRGHAVPSARVPAAATRTLNLLLHRPPQPRDAGRLPRAGAGRTRGRGSRCRKCSVSRSPRGGHRPAGKYVTYKCPIRPAVVACVARPRRRRAQKTAANRVFHAPGPGAAGAAAMRGAGTRTSGRGLPAFPCRLGYQPRRQHRRAAAESALFPVPQFFNPESELIRSEPSCGHYS